MAATMPTDLRERRFARATVNAIERMSGRDQTTVWDALSRMRDSRAPTDKQLPILRRLHMLMETEVGEPCPGCSVCATNTGATHVPD